MYALLSGDVKWGDPTYGEPSGTITWSSDIAGDLTLVSGVSDADIDTALQAAFQAWEDVAAINFVEVASGADVTVSTTSFAIDYPAFDANAVGIAGVGPITSGLNSLTSGTVEFDTDHTWSDDGSGGGINFYAVAVHEIGHIIGLDHPNDPTQIMNATIFVDDLANGDKAGAQFLYGTDGDDVVVDGEEEVSRSGDGGGSGGGAGAGLILGLLAFLASLFTGGGAAAIALAAGAVGSNEEDDDETPSVDASDDLIDLTGHSHDHDDCGVLNEDGMALHPVFVGHEIDFLPTIDFTQQANPCGCVGMCEHIIDTDETDDNVLV